MEWIPQTKMWHEIHLLYMIMDWGWLAENVAEDSLAKNGSREPKPKMKATEHNEITNKNAFFDF